MASSRPVRRKRTRRAPARRSGATRTILVDPCVAYHKIRPHLVWLSVAPWLPEAERKRLRQYVAVMDAICPLPRRSR